MNGDDIQATGSLVGLNDPMSAATGPGQGETTMSSPEMANSSKNDDKGASARLGRKRKKKVEIACVYCRRSHMICDDSRPCQRCIKRGIGHLCYDEPSNSRQRKKAAALRQSTSETTSSTEQTPTMPLVTSAKTEDILPGGLPDQAKPLQPLLAPVPMNMGQPKNLSNSVLSQTLPYNQEPLFYSEHAGSEFSSLNDFLSMIDDPDLVHGALNEEGTTGDQILNFGFNNGVITNTNFTETNGDSTTNQGIQRNGNNSSNALNNLLAFSPNSNMFPSSFPNESNYQMQRPQQPAQQTNSNQVVKAGSPTVGNQMGNTTNSTSQNPPLISDSARDKFFLTAADPTTEISPEERLKQVIKAKLEAGLLQPYNYAKGYARLQSYMDNYMNVSSRQRILKPLSIFRPAFRAIARTLKDVDLVLVEESFERMLLDYDRVFTSMAIPACLWRRTGEIYRGNKEFASLVGVKADDLKDGKLAIYELMSEESAVNFWEKYGAIAFDKGQKAVLTSCNLRTRDGIKRKSCCFSFTIRRDRYNIPSCIVGNFIPINP